MNSYLRILETSKRDRLHKVFSPGKGEESFNQWKAIRITEEMADALMARLGKVLPPELTLKVQNIKLDLLGRADAHTTLFVKAQLYDTEHRHLLLKVFVHQENSKGRTKKIARAVYQLDLAGSQGQSRVA